MVSPAPMPPPPQTPPPAMVPRPLLLRFLRLPLWVVCALRLISAVAATAMLPKEPVRLVGELGAYMSAEALVLFGSAVLLPLPLKHHLWVQLLALRSTLLRVRSLALLHASLPQTAAACARFVRWARLAVQALVPTALPEYLASPHEAECCFMTHSWLAAMLGYVLPAAVMAAFAQHAWQQRNLASAAGSIEVTDGGDSNATTISGSGGSSRSGRDGGSSPADGAGSQQHSKQSSPGSQQAGDSPDSNSSPRTSRRSTPSTLTGVLPAGIAASDVSGASSPSVKSFGSGSSGGGPGPLVPPLPRLLRPLQLTVLLFNWTLLLLPLGALVWTLLEVTVRYGSATLR